MTLYVVGLLLELVDLVNLIGELRVSRGKLCHTNGKCLEVIHHNGKLVDNKLLVVENGLLEIHDLVSTVGSGYESGSCTACCRSCTANGNVNGVAIYKLLYLLVKRENKLLHSSCNSLLYDGRNVNGNGHNLSLSGNCGSLVLVYGNLLNGCLLYRRLLCGSLLSGSLFNNGSFFNNRSLFNNFLSYGRSGERNVCGDNLNLLKTAIKLCEILLTLSLVLVSFLRKNGSYLVICRTDIGYESGKALADRIVVCCVLKEISLSFLVLCGVLFVLLFVVGFLCCSEVLCSTCYVLCSLLIIAELLVYFLLVFGNCALKFGNVCLNFLLAHGCRTHVLPLSPLCGIS